MALSRKPKVVFLNITVYFFSQLMFFSLYRNWKVECVKFYCDRGNVAKILSDKHKWMNLLY